MTERDTGGATGTGYLAVAPETVTYLAATTDTIVESIATAPEILGSPTKLSQFSGEVVYALVANST